MLSKVFTIFQFGLALALVVVILLQQKGAGLGAAFGGSGNVFSTRRGIDKLLYQATIVISILFFGVSLARFLV